MLVGGVLADRIPRDRHGSNSALRRRRSWRSWCWAARSRSGTWSRSVVFGTDAVFRPSTRLPRLVPPAASSRQRPDAGDRTTDGHDRLGHPAAPSLIVGSVRRRCGIVRGRRLVCRPAGATAASSGLATEGHRRRGGDRLLSLRRRPAPIRRQPRSPARWSSARVVLRTRPRSIVRLDGSQWPSPGRRRRPAMVTVGFGGDALALGLVSWPAAALVGAEVGGLPAPCQFGWLGGAGHRGGRHAGRSAWRRRSVAAVILLVVGVTLGYQRGDGRLRQEKTDPLLLGRTMSSDARAGVAASLALAPSWSTRMPRRYRRGRAYRRQVVRHRQGRRNGCISHATMPR